MAVLTVTNLKKSFSVRTLFSGVSFEIGKGDRVGLVGVNGCGKTTLFSIIEGRDTPDEGSVGIAKNAKVACLDQALTLPPKTSVEEAALSVFSELSGMEAQLIRIQAQLEQGGEGLEKLVLQQARVYDDFAQKGGLTYKSRMHAACLGLGLNERDLSRPISSLSGGETRKVLLAMLLLSNADLLLLDEPTNHLDIAAVEWLENFLLGFPGAFIAVSHDRYFLDRVTDRTLELQNGRLTATRGNYSRHVELKMDNRALAIRHYDNAQREIKRIEGIIAQQRRWNQERNYVTIASKQKQIDRLKADLVKPDPLPAEFRFHFHAVDAAGNEILRTKRLTKRFADKTLFEDADILIKRNERVCLLGANGCGKSTFLKLIRGKLEPDAGSYAVGANVEIGYYDQNVTCLYPEKTIFDDVYDTFPRLEPQQIRNTLGQFLFQGDAVFKRMGELSGGELARIQLLKLMMQGCNFLLLDEPTNHLDIASREALENALADYGGTMLIVTHDRYFINKLADRVLIMHDGRIEAVEGDYDSYKELLLEDGQAHEAAERAPQENEYVKSKAQRARLTKAKTELRRAERAVSDTESEIADLEKELNLPGVQSDYGRTNELYGLLTAKKALLDGCYAAWEAAEKALYALEDEQNGD